MDSALKREGWAQVGAFVLCFILIVGGLFLLYLGKSLAGIGSIGAAVAAVLAAVFLEKSRQSKELSAKRAEVEQELRHDPNGTSV